MCDSLGAKCGSLGAKCGSLGARCGSLAMMMVSLGGRRGGGRRGTALAVHPARVAAAVVLFLPDGHAVLYLVDDETAGVEGFAAVGGTHAHPHGHVAHLQGADAMNAPGVQNREALQGLGHDARAFLDREFLEGFVFEKGHLLPLVVIANPALEAGEGARAAIQEFAARRVRIDGGLSEAEVHQPPATGGMKTTASPALSGLDQSLNSLLTATLSWSRVSVKP